jgi:hypothetical protein
MIDFEEAIAIFSRAHPEYLRAVDIAAIFAAENKMNTAPSYYTDVVEALQRAMLISQESITVDHYNAGIERLIEKGVFPEGSIILSVYGTVKDYSSKHQNNFSKGNSGIRYGFRLVDNWEEAYNKYLERLG